MSGTSRRGWLVAALLVASVPAAAADLWVAVPLYNNGFEDWDGGLPAGWGREPWIRPEDCTEPGAILSADDAAAGQTALLLQGGPRSCRFDAVLQELPAEPGQVYRLRARLRSVDVDSTGRRFTNANAFLASGDAGNRTFAHALTPFLAGTNDWAEQTTSLALTPGVTRLKVGAFLSVPGRLYVDDMRLERLTPPAPAIDAPRARRDVRPASRALSRAV